MSNTAQATPFVAVAGACALAGQAAAWLCASSDQDREADRAMTAMEPARVADLKAVAVRPPDIDAFLLSAQSQGFRVIRSATNEARLVSTTGARVLARRDTTTGVMNVVGCRQEAIDHLIRTHIGDRATEVLTKKAMQVGVRRMANGESRIVARQPGGMAVTVDVKPDGHVSMDVNCAAGRTCETLVREVAEAAGLEITDMRIKTEYFVEPGERRVTLKS